MRVKVKDYVFFTEDIMIWAGIVSLVVSIIALALLLSHPASAQGWGPGHCWWDGGGMRCLPGYHWDHDQHREEWRERHQERELMERREWCDRHPARCW